MKALPSLARLGLAALLASGAAASSMSVGGCASKETLSPTEVTPSPADAGPPVAPPDATPPTPVRQILTRNPLGGPPKNLLADGDFELSYSPSSGQFGWIAALADGTQLGLDAETGGTCRSGLRCAHAKAGTILYGRGTSAADKQKIDATIWLKPLGPNVNPDPKQTCKKVASIYLVVCDDPATIFSTVKIGDGATSDGWCQFYGLAQGTDRALCMYVDLQSDALADAAIMLPSVQNAPLASLETPPAVSDEERAKVRRVVEAIRARMPVGAPRRRPEIGLAQ